MVRTYTILSSTACRFLKKSAKKMEIITLTTEDYNSLLDMLEELKYNDHSESMRGQEVDQIIDTIKLNTLHETNR